MSRMNDGAGDRIERMLGGVRERAWPGPDHCDRVDAYLKEQAMSSSRSMMASRTTIALIAAGVLGGGAVAAAVTHQVMSRRATIITDDGTRYDVELAETPQGAAGTFVTDDGTVYGINMVEDGQRDEVTVDVDSPKGGTSTIMLDNGVTPRVRVAPGEKASISVARVPAESRAVFTDEDGVEHEVDASASEAWVQPEGKGESDE